MAAEATLTILVATDLHTRESPADTSRVALPDPKLTTDKRARLLLRSPGSSNSFSEPLSVEVVFMQQYRGCASLVITKHQHGVDGSVCWDC